MNPFTPPLPPKNRAILTLVLALFASLAQTAPAPWTVDFRYAPPVWQTAIGLPDDWQKTLVGQDGSLLYDYPGRQQGFGTRISFGAEGPLQPRNQWLQAPKVPIVHTVKQLGSILLEEDAFAVAPTRPPTSAPRSPKLHRTGPATQQAQWANPPSGTDPIFESVDIGWNQPLLYRFPAEPNRSYSIVFGFCEGYHPEPGRRLLDLYLDGAPRQTVDPVAHRGRNQPFTLSLETRDANGDGWIDIAVAPAPGSPDPNTTLNALWVFPASRTPPEAALLSGRLPAPPLAFLDAGATEIVGPTPRHDILLARFHNPGRTPQPVVPTLTLASDQPIRLAADRRQIEIGNHTTVHLPHPYDRIVTNHQQWIVHLFPIHLAPGAERSLALGVLRGPGTEPLPRDPSEAAALHQRATRFWEKLDLPYDTLQVPDSGIQSLLTSSIRNIYQAREIKNGLPAFQVGPTCYRGLWVVDGAFIMEAIAYLGRTDEARQGVEYLLRFQRPDGAFMLIDGHWKETGIALWAVTRHAQLTGQKEWLRSVWPQVQRGIAFIRLLRTMPPADAPNAQLVPDGFSDGGLADRVPEYTNVYWTLNGLKAAAEAARWLDDPAAPDWQREFEDMQAQFRRAAERDLRTDAHGHRYLPIRMTHGDGIPPQKAQWAFCHAVFPGRLFPADDPLVLGNMAMLRATEVQDMVLDTGWLKNGIWNYFASFYAHAWLWLGNGPKAAQSLYAFANHASPLLVWREEHMPAGTGPQHVGDMPHNWASAEFIRLVRHALVLERDHDLHLLEAIPPSWLRPNAVTRVRELATSFGPLSFELTVNRDATKAAFQLTPPRRETPSRIVLHLGPWAQEPALLDLNPSRKTQTTIPLKSPQPQE